MAGRLFLAGLVGVAQLLQLARVRLGMAGHALEQIEHRDGSSLGVETRWAQAAATPTRMKATAGTITRAVMRTRRLFIM